MTRNDLAISRQDDDGIWNGIPGYDNGERGFESWYGLAMILYLNRETGNWKRGNMALQAKRVISRRWSIHLFLH